MFEIFKNKNFKKILIIISIVLTYITICAVYLISFHNSLIEDTRTFFEEVSESNVKLIEQNINSSLDLLRTYSISFSDYKNKTKEENLAVLSQLNDSGHFYDLMLINIDGNALSLNYGETNINRRKYFRLAIMGIDNVSETIINDFTGKETNAFSVPIYTDNVITGVLCGMMLSNYLPELIQTNCYDNTSITYIIYGNGDILVSAKNDYFDLKVGNNILNITELSEEQIQTTIKNVSARNANGSFIFSKDNRNYYAGYNAMSISEWIVLMVVPESSITSVTGNMESYVFIFTIGFLLIVLIIIIYLINTKSMYRSKFELSEEKFSEIINVDSLTGYGTFELFSKEMAELFKINDYSNKYVIISMDINKFRAVNDLLGYEKGNQILQKLSDVIKRNLSDDETFTRIIADSFIILMKYISDSDTATRIDNIINDADYQITEFRLVMAFGVYRIVDKGMELRSLIDRADLARRVAKNHIESAYIFFDSHMLSKVREEKSVENIMENALLSNEFKVYLQPKFDLKNQKNIIGAEALIRWMRDGNLIPPAGFIPLFEKNGFIVKLDRFVFEEVCKQQKIWLSHGYKMRVISVNASRYNLQNVHFVKELYNICQKYNVPTKYFEIEITESAAFESAEILSRVFRELKEYGFHISIDDFGSGYSSLNMLKDLPVDVIKIDRAFLTDSEKNDRAKEIIAHVISLAISLNMQTICEGLETLDQVNLLAELDCDMAQGYYFARPMPISEYEKLLYGKKDSNLN